MAQQLVHAIGVSEPLFLDKQLYEIQENDLFLLCSDGLYKELTEVEIAQYLTEKTSVKKAVRSLMNSALQRGARDNVTALAVKVSRII